MKKLALSNFYALALALALVASAGLPATADAPLVSITGTVVSNMDGVLVLATDKGNLRFDLDKDTVMPAQIPVGSRITVDYDSDDKVTDKMDARRIVMSPEPSAVTPAPTVSTPEPTPQETATTYQEEPGELPATASPLPLMAGIGMLTLAAGLLLRRRA
jgi:hypothetical protein